MTNKDLVARGLDVAARSIDLLAILGEFSNRSSPMYQLALEFGRWLEREKLSHWQLQSCLKEARDLVLPNAKGQEFFDLVLEGSQTRAAGPIFARPHGSLGRHLAGDIHLRWVTSTISCLFEYHSEGFIADVLCSFIMQSKLATDQKPLSESRLAYHPMRLQIKPVLDKMVSSIWCNVVNSLGIEQTSSGILRLPKELRDICPRGHFLESHTLGLAMSRLRDCPAEVIIESEHLLSNLTLWLILHFHGKLRVVVSGATIYEIALGDENKRIELRTKRFCEKDENCKGEAKPMFKMYTVVGNKLHAHLSGVYDTQMTMESAPRKRVSLYERPIAYVGSSVPHSLRLRARSAAKRIMTWLLDRTIETDVNANELSFRVVGGPKASGKLTVADIVANVPLIRNKDWEIDEDAASVVFAYQKEPTVDDLLEPDDSDDMMDFATGSGTSEDDNDGPLKLLNYFPILRDLLVKVKKTCKCHTCRLPNTQLTPGCLQSEVIHEVLFYISHAIADSLGATDSSARSFDQIRENDLGVSKILLEAAEQDRQVMNWNAWLNTASQVVLGCDSLDTLNGSTSRNMHYTENSFFSEQRLLGATTVAVQFGHLAVIAPWIDIAAPIQLKRCFRIIVSKGQIGVIVTGMDGKSQFQPVEAETAVVQTIQTEETVEFVARFPKQEEPPETDTTIPTDHSEVSSDYVLMPDGPNLYKLLMRVSSGNHSRFVDPSRAILKISQKPPMVVCKHSRSPVVHSPKLPRILKTYPFDDLLGRWSAPPSPLDSSPGPTDDEVVQQAQFNEQGFQIPSDAERTYAQKKDENSPSSYHFSFGLDTYFKYHTALALAHNCTVLENLGGACMNCALEEACRMDATDGTEEWNHDRWIINRKMDAARTRPKEASLKQLVERTDVGQPSKRLRITGTSARQD